MKLQQSVLLYYSITNSRIEIRDKYMQNVLHFFSVPSSETIAYWTYDELRRLVWINTTSNNIHRIRLDQDGGGAITSALEQTISAGFNVVAAGYGQRMIVNPNTGALYVVKKANHSNRTIYKIEVDGTTISTSIAVTMPGYLYDDTDDTASISIDPISNRILMIEFWQCRGSTVNDTSYTYPIARVIEGDLSGWEDFISVNDVVKNFRGYSTYYDWISQLETQQTNDFNRDYEVDYSPHHGCHMYFLDNDYMAMFNSSHETINWYYSHEISAGYGLTQPMIRVGKKSGHIHMFTNTKHVCLDTDLVTPLVNKTFSFSSYYIAFNSVTEEYYRYETTTDDLVMYSKFGVGLTTGNIEEASFLRVIPGGESDTVSTIAASTMVYPTQGKRTTDITPTVVFQVGENPTGWTQQFRVVVDDDPVIIGDATWSGTAVSGTFEHIADSFASGDYYDVDWAWQYSGDYDAPSGIHPNLNGTWASTGTGDGLQSGGTEGVNGVNSDSPGSRYVRFTMPESATLSGAVDNNIWYFKVFSVSS